MFDYLCQYVFTLDIQQVKVQQTISTFVESQRAFDIGEKTAVSVYV